MVHLDARRLRALLPIWIDATFVIEGEEGSRERRDHRRRKRVVEHGHTLLEYTNRPVTRYPELRLSSGDGASSWPTGARSGGSWTC